MRDLPTATSPDRNGADRALSAGVRLAFATAVTLAVAFAGPALAQRKDEVELQLELKRDRLGQTERRAQSIQSDLVQLNTEQARINEQLIDIGRAAQISEARMSQIEGRLGELDAQEKLVRGALGQRQGQMSKLFGAMQRMGRNPPPVIVTRREDALQMVRSAMLLARAFPELKSQADELSKRLGDLVRVMAEIRTEGDKLKSETSKLTDARTRLASLMESKRQSLTERQRELDDVRRSAAEISRSVTDLSELIVKLDRAVTQHTTLGAYEKELREQEAASPAPAQAPAPPAQIAAAPTGPTPQSRPAGQPPSASSSPAPATRPDDVIEPPFRAANVEPAPGAKVALAAPRGLPAPIALEPRSALASNPGRMKPAIPFHLAKGQLPLPAQGRKLLGFGDKNQFGKVSKGLVIETRPGGTVTSPCDGWVVYSGEFRSYGQVLIVNAGGGYHVLLANLSRVDVEVGRFVLAGEPVGSMSSNFIGKAQDNAPVLYVEFRNKEGQSIDPASWWADGSQKVQG